MLHTRETVLRERREKRLLGCRSVSTGAPSETEAHNAGGVLIDKDYHERITSLSPASTSRCVPRKLRHTAPFRTVICMQRCLFITSSSSSSSSVYPVYYGSSFDRDTPRISVSCSDTSASRNGSRTKASRDSFCFDNHCGSEVLNFKWFRIETLCTEVCMVYNRQLLGSFTLEAPLMGN